MITFVHEGKLSKTFLFLKRAIKFNLEDLDKYGIAGVDALADATPKRTGLTANSWYYEIIRDENGVRIEWRNRNVKEGWANVAVLLQYGHATGTGGWVEGIDYINPALRPIFETIADNAWKEVMMK